MITVLDFYATWCHPCKKLDPELKKLEINYPNINFLKIDIEEQKELCEKYNIKAVPTIIIINENKEILSKIEGFNLPLLLSEIKKLV